MKFAVSANFMKGTENIIVMLPLNQILFIQFYICIVNDNMFTDVKLKTNKNSTKKPLAEWWNLAPEHALFQCFSVFCCFNSSLLSCFLYFRFFLLLTQSFYFYFSFSFIQFNILFSPFPIFFSFTSLFRVSHCTIWSEKTSEYHQSVKNQAWCIHIRWYCVDGIRLCLRSVFCAH